MLKILQGDFCPDRTDALFAELGKEIGKGKRVFLVVPEQQTLLAEKEAARRLPPSSALNFEVTNPSRLANSVFRTEGGIAGEYADGTASALLMWRTLSESQNSLSHAMRGTVTAGSVAKALRAVKEMDSLGLDAGILKATAEGMAGTGGRLENKLLDLSVILAGYRDRLKEKYSDVAEDIVGLTEKVRNDPSVFEGAVFWFDGFTSFTEPQYEFLKVLIEIAEVNVCLILPKGSEDAYEFSECRRTDKRLTELAKSVFAETPRGVIGSHLCKHEGLTALSRVIWRNTGSLTEEEITDLTSCMKIVKTKNPHEEAAYLSSDIKSRVMAGARYRDFAVIMRNAEDYLGFVDVSFAENGIPAFIANKRDVTSFEAVKLIRAAYRCVSAHFDRTDVLAYAKCALSGISRDECDDFELYTELWNINHGQFTSEVRWNMNPEGYTDRINPGNAAALDRLNGIRRRLIAPLEILAGDSEGERTVEDHAKNLLDFLIKIDLETSLEARAEALKKQGEDELAEENLRLWDCILSVLEKLVFVLGDFKADAKTFTTLLDLAFSSIDIGRIPSFADEVTVGSADLIRLPEKKYVYLLGVNQGEFPSAALSESYFSEKEKQTLSALGLKTQPEGDVKLAREYFIFSRAMLAGSDFLTLVYTEKNAAFGAVKPADVLSRIDKLLEKKDPDTDAVICRNPLRETWEDLPLSERVYTPTVGADLLRETKQSPEEAALKHALSETSEKARIAVGEGKIENDALKLTETGLSALYPGDLNVTKSILESFRKCPMQHYLQYSLHLDDNRAAAFDPSNVGTLVHFVLETYLKELTEKGIDPETVSREDRYGKVKEIADNYLTQINGGKITDRQSHFYDKLIRSTDAVTENVFEDVGASGFKPKFFELGMEDGDPDLPEPLYVTAPDGTRISVYGVIDRVDTFRDGNRVFVRVVDYKTGKDHFSPSDLKKGKNLQMFLYLRAVTESERFRKQLGAGEGDVVLPAGVLYLNTKLDTEVVSCPAEAAAAFKSAQVSSGMCSSDPAVIGATPPNRLPFRLTKFNTVNGADIKKSFNEETWGEVCRTVSDAVAELATGIKSGNISATAQKSGGTVPCAYCSFAPICRSAKA